MNGVRVAPGAHHQTGIRINGTTETETGTEIHATATAGAARVTLLVDKGRLTLHVPWILILPVLVIPTMGGSTEAMTMPVPETTAGKTGIATEIGTETETGIEDTTDETILGHPETTIVQTVPP